MLPSQVLIVARSEKSYASYLPDGFATFIRFNFRAGEGIGTLPLGGRLGTGMSRTLILLGLILVAVGLPDGGGAARSGWDACRATSSWSMFILEPRHTRTADEPGKARPGHARGSSSPKPKPLSGGSIRNPRAGQRNDFC